MAAKPGDYCKDIQAKRGDYFKDIPAKGGNYCKDCKDKFKKYIIERISLEHALNMDRYQSAVFLTLRKL